MFRLSPQEAVNKFSRMDMDKVEAGVAKSRGASCRCMKRRFLPNLHHSSEWGSSLKAVARSLIQSF
jgi:hypothetical protein